MAITPDGLEALRAARSVHRRGIGEHFVRHLDERDLRILKAYDVRVSHNPTSNMYLSSGVAPIPAGTARRPLSARPSQRRSPRISARRGAVRRRSELLEEPARG